jgi:BirA family biotin operon repressor/biotin-[acetyl-CoA-carboxylase] ligase
MAAPWFEDEIAAELGLLLPSLAVEVVAEIDSTSSELMRRARVGPHAPVLLVAEHQTAGRGRLGRSWQGAPDAPRQAAPLTFSLGLPLAPRDWSGLSLAVGVSVAESLDPSGAAGVALKWPNDLWLQDRKLGGILIETALLQPEVPERYVVIGIGLNIGPRTGRGLSTAPAWLQEWRPLATAAEVLRELLPPLVRDLQLFEQRGFVPFAARFAARDTLKGREVVLSDGTEGHCEGVGWGGELLVRTAQGLQTITSSEVSVRPRRPPR